METAVLDIFSKECKIHNSIAKGLALKLELLIESKHKSQLYYCLLKLSAYRSTSILGYQIMGSINTIYRYIHPRIKQTQMTAFTILRLVITVKQTETFQRQLKRQLVLCVQTFQDHVFQNQLRAKALNKIVFRQQFHNSLLVKVYVRWLAMSGVKANRKMQQIQDELAYKSVTYATQKFRFATILIKKAFFIKRIEVFHTLRFFKPKQLKQRKQQLLYSVLKRLMVKHANERYMRKSRQGVNHLIWNKFKDNLTHQRILEQKKQKVIINLVGKAIIKEYCYFTRWKLESFQNVNMLKGFRKLTSTLGKCIFKSRFITFAHLKRGLDVFKDQQRRIVRRCFKSATKPLLQLAFLKIRNYHNVAYVSVPSSFNSVKFMDVNAFNLFKTINKYTTRTISEVFHELQQFKHEDDQDVLKDMAISESILANSLSQKLKQTNERYHQFKGQFIIYKYVSRIPDQRKKCFDNWKINIQRLKYRQKLAIIKQIESLENDKNELVNRYNPSQHTPSPNQYDNLDLIQPLRLQSSEGSQKYQDYDYDPQSIQSLQQLEYIENQNIALKIKLQDQEHYRAEIKTQFEMRRNHYISQINRLNGQNRSPQPQEFTNEQFVLRSQDLYGN